jgi:hypothetical protein
MSKFKFLVVLVKPITNQASNGNNQENVMKFLSLFTSTPHTYTLQETIEWNALVSSAILGQHEPFSDKENLDWDLMVDAVRYEQVGIPSTASQAYAEMGMGWEEEADKKMAAWDYSDDGFDTDDECPCMGSNDHCHRCSTWETPFVCKGCGHKEWYEGMDDFCRVCQVDGTEDKLRGRYDDEVKTAIAI